MPGKSSNLGQFWQELKRRKVVRVITVYAASSFIILELVDIISPALSLPTWTVTFAIVFLCIGFIIAVILSWVYDITPEGIEKTKPVIEIKEEVSEKPTISNSWRIASYISFVVIVALIVFNIVSSSNRSKEIPILDKSIAILPFINDSPDEENEYFINGTMEAILDNLCKIEDLRVIGRTSVEQYRNAPKPIPVIAKEMNVSYILEGSGQKYGDNIRLTIQLLDAVNEKHLWSSPYSREVEIEEIFTLQSEIAQLVAAEIKAIITPEEKQLIEKTPTTNLTAYDFYQRGKDEYLKYHDPDNENPKGLEKAEDLYYKALEYDSTFAQAYAGLADVYLDKHYWEDYYSEDFLDSVLVLADIALSYDNQLAEAYTIRGFYYNEKGLTEQAIKEFDKAIKFNPNDWRAYRGKGYLYSTKDDIVKAIDNFQKAASVNHGSEFSDLLRGISSAYLQAGFTNKAIHYSQEAIKLDGDSVRYYWLLGFIEKYKHSNFEKAIEFFEKGYAIDSNHLSILGQLGNNYKFIGQYEEALKYYKKLLERRKAQGFLDTSLPVLHLMNQIGYVYWLNGDKEEAKYYFSDLIDIYNRINELGRGGWTQARSYYILAGEYAFRGEKDKAYENLRTFNLRQGMPFHMPTLIKIDPLFESIRNEPEFQQIVRDVEAKYQAEHERVRKWLEENDML